MDKSTKHPYRVRYQMMSRAPFNKRHPVLFFLLIAAGITLFLLYFAGKWLPLYPCWLLCLSVVTFLFYAYDKDQSEIDAWRIPEDVLYLLSLAGGFIGAFLGRAFYRHKTQKIASSIVIVLSALLHIALILYFWLKRY